MKRLIGRLQAALNVLTSSHFVVMVYDKKCIDTYSNVSREAFQALVQLVDAGLERNEQAEAEESLVGQAKELLKKPLY